MRGRVGANPYHRGHRTMTVEDIKRALGVLELRERLIFKLGVFAALRPGEIFWSTSVPAFSRYRGYSRADLSRKAGHTKDTEIRPRGCALRHCPGRPRKLAVSPNGVEGWLFPSEKLTTPLSKDNALYRYMRPRLKTVGLEWVDFQVMRRMHASLMRELGVDPKIVADLMGHDVNVNLNVYTQTSLESRLQAVETLETAFVN